MSNELSIVALALVAALGAACDDAAGVDPSSDDLGADQSAAAPDLLPCTTALFNGFPGDSAAPRRLECTPCGCTVDTLEGAAGQALWAQTIFSSTLSESAAGAVVTNDGSSGPAFATLVSTATAGPFYADGDFDLRLDYAVIAAAPGGSAFLRVDLASGSFFEVSRGRALGGADTYAATLAGIPSSKPSSEPSGVLRLVRAGNLVTAYGDGIKVGASTAGGPGRVAISVGAGVDGCAGADGGACEQQVTLHQVRLASGALVDR